MTIPRWIGPHLHGGAAKRKLLSQLPLYFDEILPSDSSKQISKLWKVNLHTCLSESVNVHAYELLYGIDVNLYTNM